MSPTVPAPTLDSITLEKFGAIYAERLGKPVSANHQACFKQFCAFTAPSTDTTYGARPLTAFTEDDIEVFFVAPRRRRASRSPPATSTCRW